MAQNIERPAAKAPPAASNRALKQTMELIVVDINAVRGGLTPPAILQHSHVLVPNHLLQEVVTSDKPAATLAPLNRLARCDRSPGRVYMGRYWHTLSDREATPMQIRSGPLAAICRQTTHALRRALTATDRPFLEDGDAEIVQHNALQRTEYIRLARSHADWLKTDHPSKLRELRSGGVAGIASYFHQGINPDLLLTPGEERYRSADWTEELSQSPPRGAMARYLSLAFYFTLRLALDNLPADKRIGNTYDDLHYAFLALYTGSILTNDKALREAVQAISGSSVRVYPNGDLES